MDALLSLIPSAENGLLPRYLFVVAIVAIGNAAQNLVTLHYTRRLYRGLFVPNPEVLAASASAPSGKPRGTAPGDRVDKLILAPEGLTRDSGSGSGSGSGSALVKDKPAPHDQVTPLAARLFGTYTALAGLIRLYASWHVDEAPLYQLALLTHLLAAGHFTSEMLVFGTCRFSWEMLFPLGAGWSGLLWMSLQYSHYVR